MRPYTYERVANENPEMKLPLWENLSLVSRKRARRMNRETLLRNRVIAVIKGDLTEECFQERPQCSLMIRFNQLILKGQ